MDGILLYLLDHLVALKACSLTCKSLFGATRPLIHRQFVCFGSRPGRPRRKKFLLPRPKRDPGAFGRLIYADRSGFLRHTLRLTIRMVDGPLNPIDMQEYLPHLRSITKLHSLTLDNFHVHPFIPVFDEHFGTFTNTLRHLDIRNARGTERELLYIICQFPLLEDLSIISPAGKIVTDSGPPVPTITQSPPLRGKLVLVQAHSREFLEGFVAFPGGLNFRSLEIFPCEDSRVIMAACGRTLTSISYLRRANVDKSESRSLYSGGHCDVTIGDYSDPAGPHAKRSA